MEKFIFIATIKNRLEELNVPQQTIDKHLFVFEKCFKGKSAADIDKVIKGAGGMDGIVQSIYNLELAKQKANPKSDLTEETIIVPPSPVVESQEETTEIKIDAETEQTAESDTNELTAEYLSVDLESFSENQEQTQQDDEKTVVDLDVNIQKSPDFEKHVEEAEKISIELEKTANNNVIKEATQASEDDFDISEYDFDTLFAKKTSKIETWVTNLRKNMSDKTYKATLSLSILLFALTFAVVSLLFPLLLLSGIAMSIGYIVTLVGGIVFSLVPIGYGIYTSFSSISIGLYEIGIGVTFVGIVMLSCILMYNYTKRLVPYLFGKLKILFKFCIKLTKIYFKNEIKEDEE